MKTFKQQFDLLTEAYINDQVQPYDGCACFVGNMLGRNTCWCVVRSGNPEIGKGHLNFIDQDKFFNYEFFGYDSKEIIELENTFMGTIFEQIKKCSRLVLASNVHRIYQNLSERNREEILFIAFEKTLDVLKQIHVSHGEVIDEVPTFKKRSLA